MNCGKTRPEHEVIVRRDRNLPTEKANRTSTVLLNHLKTQESHVTVFVDKKKHRTLTVSTVQLSQLSGYRSQSC